MRTASVLSSRLGQSSTADRPLALAVDRVRVARLPIPDILADWIVRQFDPTLALRRLPAVVSLPSVRIRSGQIEIGDQQ